MELLKKVVFFENLDIFYRKSHSNFTGILRFSLILVVFFPEEEHLNLSDSKTTTAKAIFENLGAKSIYFIARTPVTCKSARTLGRSSLAKTLLPNRLLQR